MPRAQKEPNAQISSRKSSTKQDSQKPSRETYWHWIVPSVAMPILLAIPVVIHEADWIQIARDGLTVLRDAVSKPQVSAHTELRPLDVPPPTSPRRTVIAPDVAEQLRQFNLFLQLEKDAQAYRLGQELIETLPPDARSLLPQATIEASGKAYRDGKFGNAARLMKDALRPLINSTKH